MADADQVLVTKGFTVEIANYGFLPIKEKRGGERQCERVDVTHGKSKHGEASTGHVTWSELELVAYATPGQKHFADIMHKVAIQGQQERVNITVTELAKDKTPVKTITYFDCLIRSLDFARVQAGSGELLTETATFLPQRAEVS